jgi:hypothetical protein
MMRCSSCLPFLLSPTGVPRFSHGFWCAVLSSVGGSTESNLAYLPYEPPYEWSSNTLDRLAIACTCITGGDSVRPSRWQWNGSR